MANESEKKSRKKPQCPKCRSAPGTYRELAATAYRFELENNQFTEAPALMTKGVAPTRRGFVHGEHVIDNELDDIDPTGEVLAECSNCGHVWKLRNFNSIDDLIDLHGVAPSPLKT